MAIRIRVIEADDWVRICKHCGKIKRFDPKWGIWVCWRKPRSDQLSGERDYPTIYENERRRR